MSRPLMLVLSMAACSTMAVGAGQPATTPGTQHSQHRMMRVHFDDPNRDFVIRAAAELGISTAEAYKTLLDAAAEAAAKDHVETEFAAVAAVHAMRAQSGSTPGGSWTGVIRDLRTKGLIGPGLLTSIRGDSGSGSSDGETSRQSCSCECDVYYVGSCGSDDCQLCADCCDTTCGKSCASSTGCSDCKRKAESPTGR